jgi:hypothetical protein
MNNYKFEGLSSISFHNRFETELDCLEYLFNLKWANGYKCKKCSNEKSCPGKKELNLRCTKCRYEESPTAGTMFDKVKFSILIAFHIIFKISTKKKGMSTMELSNEFELRQPTCWAFKWKIQQAMRSSKKHTLKESVYVDEFFIGGPELGKKGRAKGKKRLVVVALEKVKNEKGVGRAYAKIIEHASALEFAPFFKDYIDKNAIVTTDEWTGYSPLKSDYSNLKQIPSKNGSNFLDLHIHIMNLKGWLRGIHHHCSKERLQGYLDEYHYRYNRRNNLESIFHLIIKKMVENKPIRLNSID